MSEETVAPDQSSTYVSRPAEPYVEVPWQVDDRSPASAAEALAAAEAREEVID